MATKSELFVAVRKLRDTLHERLDDNISDRVFSSLRLRHIEAVIQSRREVEDQTLLDPSNSYDTIIVMLNTASIAVSDATDTDENEMLAALKLARLALAEVAALP